MMRRWKSILRSKKGAPTMEYIVIIGVGVLFASLLLLAASDNAIAQAMKNRVITMITGQQTQQVNPLNPNVETDPGSLDPNHPAINNGPSFTQTMSLVVGAPPSSPKRNDGGGGGFTDWLSDTWNTSSNWVKGQAKQFWGTDIKGATTDPLRYIQDSIGWKDIKKSAKQLWNDPGGYFGQSWDNTWAGLEQAWDDPLGTAWTFIYDHDTFMQAWHGKDENNKSLTIGNRLFKAAESLPLPTKVVKIAKWADNIFVHKKPCACPTNIGGKGKHFTKGGNEQFTKEILATKPKHSPVPEKWLNKGGSISIDNNGVWTYTNKKGQSVRYPGGYPDFSNYLHPKVKSVKIKFAKPENRPKDFKEANLKAGLDKNSDPPVPANNRPPDGYTWHHHQDGTTMQLVERKVHDEFKHAGGISNMK